MNNCLFPSLQPQPLWRCLLTSFAGVAMSAMAWGQSATSAREAAAANLSQRLAELPTANARGLSNSGSFPAAQAAQTADDDLAAQEILVRAPQSNNWSVSATSTFMWDTNPGFSPIRDEDSAVFSQSATIRYAKVLGESWLADISVQELLYRYDRFPGLDFDRLSGRATFSWNGLSQVLNDWGYNWIPSVGVEWFRLNEGGSWSDSILDQTSLQLGFARVFAPKLNHQFVVALSASLSLDASVEASERDEYALTTGWLKKWAPRWESTLYARGAFYDYKAHDDWNLSAGLLIEYVPRTWCRFGLMMSATTNESNADLFDYHNFSLGASLGLRVAF